VFAEPSSRLIPEKTIRDLHHLLFPDLRQKLFVMVLFEARFEAVKAEWEERFELHFGFWWGCVD